MTRLAMWVMSSVLVAGSAARADVSLSTEQRETLGIEIAELSVQDVPRSWHATAQVLDDGALLASLSELEAAREALEVSEAELRRSQKLFADDTNVALKVVEAARTQRSSDRSRLTSLEAQLRSTWGAELAAAPAGALARLKGDLLSGKASLVRVDLAGALPQSPMPRRVRLVSLDDARQWSAEWIGRLPRTTGSTLGGAVLVRTSARLESGLLLAAEVSDASANLKGVRVPASAVVRWHGAEWCYVAQGNDTFSRRSLSGSSPLQGDRLLAIEDGGPLRVVSAGARSVLAAELGAADEPAAGEGHD